MSFEDNGWFSKFVHNFSRLFKHHMVWLIGGGSTLYATAVILVPHEQLRDMVYYLSAVISLMIVVLYAPTAYDGLRRNRMNGSDQVLYGIVIVFFGLFMTYSWVSIRRNLNISWMYESPVLTYFVWLTSIGGMLYILAPGSIRTHVPKRNIISLVIAVTLSILLTVFFILLQYFPSGVYGFD